ncbi:LysM domain-containing protein [Aerococcus agrisoli]|uniref:LysM domain-containing protein n=1 Tax=Aerococcus agrisoli TaxID=2487350 RepID=A0A3N4GG79_9LACT|nr:LysM domain-containing protein [Aerococcus agrisoli]RPA57600.1 LysM domain-containing protein [Aerococcus agrisoli]
MPAWLSKFIEKWQSQSRATQWTIIGILSIALLLIIIPWRASADENNPLGIEASSLALSGSSQYSAEPLSISEGAQGVSLGDASSSSSSSAVNLDESVSLTKDGESSENLTSLTQEYEAFSSELAASRSNDPSYTAPSVSGSSSSSSSSATTSSSAATSSSSVTEESSSVAAGGSTYTVQSGDNAYRIAVNNGLTLEEFLSLNGKTEAVVTPGEVVRVQ